MQRKEEQSECLDFIFSLFFLFILLQLSPHFPPIPISTQPRPQSPPLLRPSPHCGLCPWVILMTSLANPFTFFHPGPSSLLPSNSCQFVPCIHTSVSILFISLFCSLAYSVHWTLQYGVSLKN